MHTQTHTLPLRKECAWLAEQSGRGAFRPGAEGEVDVGRENGEGVTHDFQAILCQGCITLQCWQSLPHSPSSLPPSIFLIPLFSLILHRELDHNDISGTIEDTNGAFSGLDSLNKLWVSPLTLHFNSFRCFSAPTPQSLSAALQKRAETEISFSPACFPSNVVTLLCQPSLASLQCLRYLSPQEPSSVQHYPRCSSNI